VGECRVPRLADARRLRPCARAQETVEQRERARLRTRAASRCTRLLLREGGA
jgi:hypothetical protein